MKKNRMPLKSTVGGGGGAPGGGAQTTLRTGVGEAVVFAGGLEHAGARVTGRGTRYILVVFVHMRGSRHAPAERVHIRV